MVKVPVGSAQEAVPGSVGVPDESDNRSREVHANSEGALAGCRACARCIERGDVVRLRSASIYGKAQSESADDKAKRHW